MGVTQKNALIATEGPRGGYSGNRRSPNTEVRVYSYGDTSERMDVLTPDHPRRVNKHFQLAVHGKADSASEIQVIASLKSVVIAPVRPGNRNS